MKPILLLILIVSGFIETRAQNFKKVIFDKESLDGYYLATVPNSDKIKGVLLLLPGFGQSPETIFPESKLQNVAFLNGILTVAIAGGRKLYADDSVISRLNRAVEHIKEKYNIPSDRFIIGGFSAGGTISLRYVEYCYEATNKTPISPQAVFSVDSPVDLFHIWNYFGRELNRNFSEVGMNEANFVKNIMINEIGDPINNVENYNRLTPFNANMDLPGNERFLKDISVRVYHDVDVDWLLNNRRRSLYDSNALPASELINKLTLLGNDSAEFMQSAQPGYRSNGLRHPHSWSIVDEVELVQWALEHFEK